MTPPLQPSAHLAYFAEVAAEVGVRPESVILEEDTAYLWLDRRVATHPTRAAALLWTPHHGWSLAVETHSGEDLIILRDLGPTPRPTPAAVAHFATTARQALPVAA
ncbi:hypothetical protein JOD54_003865 [Actinokineospora baliensis]|uniref:DUF6292 family protein n=1 Tax=Actinokineospora baliensis TaxID=547056 RepID=UPI00195BA796|nr:DUF6292 family protein [Actinokineospora baliensis]MBM7773661.1 hypothetical protein [Actinokineospora baliensis]